MATDVNLSKMDGEGLSTRRERVGWYFYDWANSAFPTTVLTVFLGPYLNAVTRNAADEHGQVHPLGLSMAAGSVYLYTVGLSVLLSAVLLPVVGAIADRSSRKKELLALFTYVGAAATAGFVFLTGSDYLLGVALLLVSNLAFSASIAVYNSFLPQLAGPDDRDTVSSVGWAIGYIGGGLLLALNLVAYGYKDSLHLSEGAVARYSLLSAGLWWAAFTTIPLLWLRNRPASAGEARGSVLIDGFRQLRHTVRDLRAYPLTLLFLGAYLLYNDGIQTVITTAGIFATDELGLSQEVLTATILLVQFVAFGGALLMGRLARSIGAGKTLTGCLVAWTAVLAMGYVLPAGKVGPFLALGVAIGIVLGGSQALSRSLFSQLIPKGKEAECFGLYEISDKGSAALGPIISGLAFQLSGSYRTSIISMVGFFVVGIVALLAIPLRRAILAVGNTPPRVL
jgi:UMF1 family MFS transporter